MEPRQYFPLGKAYGDAFCNRTDETAVLLGNIQAGKHTFIAAPRRYGKSSLCENALSLAQLPMSKTDLHVATSDKGVERLILKAIIALIGQTAGNVDKAIQSLKYAFHNLKPKFSLEAAGVMSLELEPIAGASVAETLREAILLLDRLLITKKQRAILWLDEFQRIAEVAPDLGLEGGIRSAAQETQHLALLFSGSNRHLIECIFQDEGRPLYKLCKKIQLDRISASDYKSHLNRAATVTWGCNLADDIFEAIMLLTERHPYYVNYLCDSLWSSSSLPTIEQAQTVWHNIVEIERSDLLKDYFRITESQKKLLKYIACYQGQSIYSTDAATRMEMASTSVPKALYSLLDLDLVEEYADKQYRTINPIYKTILQE